jgi:hypothetical protein
VRVGLEIQEGAGGSIATLLALGISFLFYLGLRVVRDLSPTTIRFTGVGLPGWIMLVTWAIGESGTFVKLMPSTLTRYLLAKRTR